jgi:hypothetical protein
MYSRPCGQRLGDHELARDVPPLTEAWLDPQHRCSRALPSVQARWDVYWQYRQPSFLPSLYLLDVGALAFRERFFIERNYPDVTIGSLQIERPTGLAGFSIEEAGGNVEAFSAELSSAVEIAREIASSVFVPKQYR